MLIVSEHFHASDLGRQRQGNEDSFFVRAPLFVVADGMGGAQAGEVASEMAVESFDRGLPDGSPAQALVQVIEDANRRIHDRSRAESQRAGMGTTVTAAYVGEGAVMGRGDQAEIRLEDPFASSRHARLVRQGGIVVLEDLGSTNGTYLNEELVSGPQPLHPGDRLRIGDSEFTYLDR